MSSIVLETKDLTKRYGALTAVRNLSLQVRAGEVFGLLGPNGAGKTTSINMLCGLLKPDAGRVLIHGVPVNGGDADARARVGVCPQNIVLWGTLTCLEQLEFIGEMNDVPRRIARARGLALLEALGLSDKRNQLARTLSGGMQRRLNLAMALVHDPDILVLDEPEAGLDPQSRVLVREYIKSLVRQPPLAGQAEAIRPKTIILTTHNMDEADRMADRVAIIDHGQLLVVDTPEALKRRVGEGDVLEIEVNEAAERAVAAVAAIAPGASMANYTLVIRARGVAERLPALLEALKAAGVRPGEVRLRENTLEDVFISLTGRRLRE
jgi:ABC-2 type transport system ATP-binding protein